MFWYCTHYVCCPIFLVFFVVFECISSNIVKWYMALSSGEVRIVFFWYTLSLFSRNFKPLLVMPKFQASVSVYHAAKFPPLQPAPCYPEIFKIYLCLVVLRKLPPSQPAHCYSKTATRVKTPTSCEIPTREMPVIPLNRKNRLAQIGRGSFITYPTFRTSASLSHGSPLPSHPPTHSYT